MKLIADSGSTKTNWCLLPENGHPEIILTSGFNPYFRTTDEIAEEIGRMLVPRIPGPVQNIYFYGAGVTDAAKGDVVRQALRRFYPEVPVETESDLLAAARATCGREKGIACILGTGSNSCFYDGEKIAEQVSPLGFILGDEGSGAVMGRKLAGDYLKKVMPEDLRSDFHEMFPYQPFEILERVYRQPRPNMFLAGFTKFLSAKMEHEYCRNFIKLNFSEFIERNLTGYPSVSDLKIHFIGSLAFHFRELLLEVLIASGLNAGTIVQEPMEGLIRFHNGEQAGNRQNNSGKHL